MRLAKTSENLAKVSSLIMYAFGKQDLENDPVFLSRYEHSECFADDSVDSCLLATKFDMQYYNSVIGMSGIGYVASYPECRGNGSIKRLFKEALPTLHAQKNIVSMLAPFSQGFYRQFGYENCSFTKKYELQASAFNYFKSQPGKVRRGTWDDSTIKQAVIDLHSEILSHGLAVGSVKRAQWWWDRLDEYYKKRLYAVCYDESQQVTGYLIYRLVDTEFIIDELVYTNVTTLRQLFSYVKAHTSTHQKFSYLAPLTESIEWLFSETNDISVIVQPYMMARILDFKQLLELTPWTARERDYVFEVTSDEYCVWNQGKWLLTSSGAVKKYSGSKVDISCNIATWAALLLGNLNVQTGNDLELVNVTSDINELDRLFPIKEQKFYDYF